MLDHSRSWLSFRRVRWLCALLTLASPLDAETSPARIVPDRRSEPITAGSISVSNTIVRKSCGGGGPPAKCTWSGEPLRGDRLRPGALEALKRVLNFPSGKRESARAKLPVELVRLLVDVSDTFAGAQICVISGFRCFERGGKRCSRYQKETSRHLTGHAVDITLIGVDNVDLATYVLRLNESDGRFARRLGIGYYPNQEHVHIDVRDQPRYWVDTSFGGEPPRYDRSAPHPAQAFLLHYDARRAPAHPGGQCPTLEARSAGEAEPDESSPSAPMAWPSVFVSDSPLRGTPSVRSLLERWQVDFTPLPELEGVEAP